MKNAEESSMIYPKLMLEIGTGMGNFFSEYALHHPDTACV